MRTIGPSVRTPDIDLLLQENRELRVRLQDAEDAVRALQAGEADAVFVESGGERVYTLELPDKPYRLLVEQMHQGAATLTTDGKIIYCNARFVDLLRQPLHSLLGQPIHRFAAPDSQRLLENLLRDGQHAEVEGRAAPVGHRRSLAWRGDAGGQWRFVRSMSQRARERL
jgi:PAS domain-containing protein